MTSKAVRRKYNLLAKAYDIIYWGYIRKTNTMACQALTLAGKEQLLNIGCGTGDLEKRLIKKYPGLHLTGVDISGDMLERAKEKLAGFAHIHFAEGDFLTIDLPENSFDVIFSISNLHYFADPQMVFAKAFRLLRPGGKFILIDWNRGSLNGKLYHAYMSAFDPAFAKTYTTAEVSSLLTQCGFAIDEKITLFRVGLLWSMMRIVAKKP